MQHTDTENFYKQIIEGTGLILVDFFANWCVPCKQMTPKINKLAEEYKDELTVFSLDIEANPNTAELYQIKSIPTCLLFKGGRVISRLTGNVDIDDLQDFIDKGIDYESEAEVPKEASETPDILKSSKTDTTKS